MSQYFPHPYEHFGRKLKTESDLSNYATKADLKGEINIDTSRLASSKTKIDN